MQDADDCYRLLVKNYRFESHDLQSTLALLEFVDESNYAESRSNISTTGEVVIPPLALGVTGDYAQFNASRRDFFHQLGYSESRAESHLLVEAKIPDGALKAFADCKASHVKRSKGPGLHLTRLYLKDGLILLNIYWLTADGTVGVIERCDLVNCSPRDANSALAVGHRLVSGESEDYFFVRESDHDAIVTVKMNGITEREIIPVVRASQIELRENSGHILTWSQLRDTVAVTVGPFPHHQKIGIRGLAKAKANPNAGGMAWVSAEIIDDSNRQLLNADTTFATDSTGMLQAIAYANVIVRKGETRVFRVNQKNGNAVSEAANILIWS